MHHHQLPRLTVQRRVCNPCPQATNNSVVIRSCCCCCSRVRILKVIAVTWLLVAMVLTVYYEWSVTEWKQNNTNKEEAEVIIVAKQPPAPTTNGTRTANPTTTTTVPLIIDDDHPPTNTPTAIVEVKPLVPTTTTNELPDIPFPSLLICREAHDKLSCLDNESCMKPICDHMMHEKGSRARTLLRSYDFTKGLAMETALYTSTKSRIIALTTILADMQAKMGPNDGVVLVVGFNAGYGYLFSNWYASLLKHKVDLAQVKRHVLVLATDEHAQSLVKKFGFYAFDPYPLLEWTHMKVSQRAARKFGDGAHGHLNVVVKFSMLHDLLHVGLDVIVMDTDVVWVQNAIPVLRQSCGIASCDGTFIMDNRAFANADQVLVELERRKHGQVTTTGEVDTRPFYRMPSDITIDGQRYPMFNTGFFYMRSNPKTKRFMRTMLGAVHLQQWKATDQLIFNSLMYHIAFADMNWRLLPKNRFVGGGAMHRNRWAVAFPIQPPGTLVAIHASDTPNHMSKIRTFSKNNHWYLLPNDTDPEIHEVYEACREVPFCLFPEFHEALSAAQNGSVLMPVPGGGVIVVKKN